jgi:hypothetical protein
MAGKQALVVVTFYRRRSDGILTDGGWFVH